MAGLIQQQMQGPAQPQGQMPQEGMPEDAMDMEGGPDEETDPAYAQALELAMQALYKNGAAEDIANTITKAQDVTQTLADTAYEICSIVDERTNGTIPDELIGVLASHILEEVSDIAEAAGLELTGAEVGGAMKLMILRFVGEQGMDTTQLEAAMNEVDPAEFDQIAAGDEQAPPDAGAVPQAPQPGME